MTNVINLECHKLHDFVDGELRDDDAERFREHLASCEACAAEMPRLLELISACDESALASSAAEGAPPPIDSPARRGAMRPRSRRAGYAAAIISVAAGAALVLVWGRDPATQVSAFANMPAHRTIEVRLSYADAATHRPYEVSRGQIVREDVPFAQMEQLKRAGNWHGLAVASLLYGDRSGAARYLESAGRSGPVNTDRAALEILDGSEAALERALALLDAVLTTNPDNTAARWNRALGLARLDLPLAAAREFDRVAAAGEPGWSAEAALRANDLRAGVAPRRSAWEATDAAGTHWIAGDGPIVPPTDAPRGWLRHLYYDAVRAADSRARVEALLPLARQLDALYGGDALTRYARGVAAADFRVRAPLAAAFRDVALGRSTLDDKATEALAARMRTAGAMDLWMGIRSYTRTIGRHLGDYRTLADATGDPWFAVLAEHQEARSEIDAGNHLAGERLLFHAADSAARHGLDYQRSLIELDISKLYLLLRRLPEAEQHAREVLSEAQAAREWRIEQLAIYQLAETRRFRYSSAVARAYLTEALERERDPVPCDANRYVHQSLANLAMMELDIATARREVAAAPRCGEPLNVLAALTWADLYRFDGTQAEARAIRQQLAALRAASRDVGQLALADHVEGRLVIEFDRTAGQALLRRAIAAVAGRTDDASTKARAYSFSILALDAGRAGEYDAVLALLAEELGGSPPDRCVVGVANEDERAIVVVRGPDGATTGAYTHARSSPHIAASSLIPAALVRRLDGCAEVAVLARPPLTGAARLLPGPIAWSYRLRGSAGPHPVRPGHRLVVSDADPPAYLGLPRLFPHTGVSDAVVMRGSAATPARVVSAMRDASVIEFHTHGFVNRGLSDASFLALTPEPDGRYALTAADVQASELRGAPLVILAACQAAAGAPFLDENVGLPLAFMRAGAAAVLASPTAVNDADADAFFGAVRARIAKGASPAVAVRDERMLRVAAKSSDWFLDVVVYQ
jgi:hypothetical protein